MRSQLEKLLIEAYISIGVSRTIALDTLRKYVQSLGDTKFAAEIAGIENNKMLSILLNSGLDTGKHTIFLALYKRNSGKEVVH